MCGICGQLNPTGLPDGALQPMLHAIAHRGPDDQGMWSNGRIALGSRRLSIIDLPGGHQPIPNEDETIWIVFNGEIYNYRALRQRLAAHHTFRTHSDTEVILHLYEEMGEACVSELRGMFALAIWDGRTQKLFMARDRLGQKPLFYAQHGDQFLFASEIKSILAAAPELRRLNEEAMHHYLSLRFIPPPLTMLQAVQKLPPAHTLTYQNGQITLHRYWQLNFQHKLTMSEADYRESLRHTLRDAIASHLVSDVPVGAFLSGGLDSSIIVGIMAQDLGQSFQTFGIGVNEQSFNELPFARKVADWHGAQHHETCVEANLIQSLPQMIWHLDEPSDPIAACQYQAAALAAAHVKVVLGGDGGDELFAGFDRYAGQRYVGYYALLPALLRQGIVGAALAHLPENFAYKSATQRLRWMQQLGQLPGAAERYAEATCFFRFNQANKQQLYGAALWRQWGGLDSAAEITRPYNQAPADDPIDRMLYADYMTRLPEHSLMLTDRMTMAHSLELRSPLLDHELVEHLAAYPSRLKIQGRQLKVVLRQLAADYLPPSIVRRSKQGFMFPVAYWFRHELYPLLEAELRDSFFVREGLFRQEYVTQLLTEHRQQRVDHHVRLWMLLNLAIWHRLVIEGESVTAVTHHLQALLQESSPTLPTRGE